MKFLALLVSLTLILGVPMLASANEMPVSTEAQGGDTLPPPVFVPPGTEDQLHIKTTAQGVRYSVKEDGTVRIEGYQSSAIKLYLPAEIDGRTVNEIAPAAFYGNTGLMGISIPAGITLIGEKAFEACVNLTAVELPDSLRVIPTRCFASCKALSEINLPQSLSEIGDRAFNGCAMLGSLKAPKDLEKIGHEAFLGCEQLILDCSESPAAKDYAEINRIPQSFFDTANAQWLMLAGLVALLLGGSFAGKKLLLPRILKKKVQ